MSGWMTWLGETTFARQQHFDLTVLWLAVGVGLLIFLSAKRLFRPRYARDSKQKLIGPDALWIWSFALAGLMIVALAGPKIDTFKTIQSKDNVDIIFAVDKSVSMAIKDVASSRHEVMIREIISFVGSPAVHQGDRLTIFTFSEKSNWRMPLSQDRDEFIDKLLEVEQPEDRIYYDRSQLYTYFSGLLAHIVDPNTLAKQDNFSKMSTFPRLVFVFSDGDAIDDSLDKSLAVLARREIRVYTIGIGTSRGGSISVKTPSENNPNILEQTLVQSKLNMRAMNFIKDKTGGKSFVVNSSSSQVQSFMAASLAENRKPTLALVQTNEPENFWWDLLAIPALILVSLMVIKFVRG